MINVLGLLFLIVFMRRITIKRNIIWDNILLLLLLDLSLFVLVE